MCRKDIFDNIENEREYQDARWGTEFDDQNTANDWVTYIAQYAGRAGVMNVTPDAFEEAMTKVAALAVAAIETSQRNGGPAPRHYDAKPEPIRRTEAVDEAFGGLRFSDLPQVEGLTLSNLEDEKVREYEVFGVGVYKIPNPIGVYMRTGGTTHRVVDSRGNCHCIAYPNEGKTILRWKPQNIYTPVQW